LSDQIPVLFEWISTGLLQQDDAIVVAVQAARRRASAATSLVVSFAEIIGI